MWWELTQKPGFFSQDGKTTLSSEVICLICSTQASTNWRHCFTFPGRDRTSVSTWTSEPSEGLVDNWEKGVTSFLSNYYKITLSIGLASGTERATYRFNPACRLCRIKKRFCICSMSFVDCYRGSFVSLRNRTADRRGRQNACLWHTWQGHYLRVMSWSSQNINVFWSLQKNIYLKESEVWRKSYFKQNYCHVCHTRFAVFFPLPSCCVSSLFMVYDGKTTYNRLSSCSLFWWRRKEMCAGKIAWRHAALPFLNAWNMQASDDVIKNLNTRIATGTKINQSDDSNTRSWTAACGLRARRMPNCTCTEVITDTRGNAAQIAS